LSWRKIRYNIHMKDKFIEAEKAYKELKEKKEKGEITREEFVSELQRLMIKDQEGRLWALGTNSGRWHYYDGSKWIPAEPPYTKEKTLICPYCGFENPENSIVCIKCERSLKKVPLVCPRCGKNLPEGSQVCPYCDFTFEEKREEKEEIIFRIGSLKVLSFALFWGGAGLVLGIIFGALIGVLSSFPFINTLPESITATRGHFIGAILFGIGGAIAGFLFFWFFGLIISLFTNFIIFLFGGPKFKVLKEEQ